MLADRALAKVQKEFPDIEVEKVDVITNPARVWKGGIRMFPALRAGKDILSGILLNEDEIRKFFRKNS